MIDGEHSVIDVTEAYGIEYEAYKALWDLHMRGSDGFLLVYSTTSRSSFNRVRKLYNRIHASRESAGTSMPTPILLVGNKSDLATDREVALSEGNALARDLGCEFIETSAKDDINVEEAFHNITRIIQRQRTQAAPAPPSSAGRRRARLRQKASKCVVL